MEAVSHLLAASVMTPEGQAELDDDLAAWGATQPAPEPEAECFEVWDEHRDALLWWCNGGNQLKFNGQCCLGLDVVALQADAQLSGRTVNPDDYQKMQLIAQQVASHLNQQANQRTGNHARP